MSRIAILLTGPNASGKTTCVDDAMVSLRKRGISTVQFKSKGNEYDNSSVLAVHADQALSSGTAEEQAEKLGRLWKSAAPVLLVEGIDRGARAFNAAAHQGTPCRSIEVHITQMVPDVMRSHLKARCEKRGKQFRADYWDNKKCAYEGAKRYRNMARRIFPGASFWTIDEEYQEVRILSVFLTATIIKALHES